MSSPVNLALLAAAAAVLLLSGVLLGIAGATPRPVRSARPPARLAGKLRGLDRRGRILAGSGVAAGILIWALTGWVVAVLLLPAVALLGPYLLTNPTGKAAIDRLEAMEEWTRSLTGVLTVGAGIETALIATLRTTPAAIEPEVRALVARLRAQWPTPDALRRFAADLNDPTGDLIAMTLLLGASRRGDGLASVLRGLSETVAEDVKNRRVIEAQRSGPRATARWITLITAIGAVYLIANPTYSAPYGTPLGQVIYLLLACLLIAALLWLRRMTTGRPPPRILTDPPPVAATTSRPTAPAVTGAPAAADAAATRDAATEGPR